MMTRLSQARRANDSLGKALKNYNFLSQNNLSKIPQGSEIFGTPEALKRDEPAEQQISLWSLLGYGPSKAGAEYVYKRSYIPHDAEAAQKPGGDLMLSKSLSCTELDKYGRELRARKNAFWERLSMGLFGGVALIAPMLIMTLRSSRTTSLVTASTAVILFALVLAFFANKSAGKDVLLSTAAYAAVLIVFVGKP